VRILLSRLWAALRRRPLDRELDEEIEAHLDLAAAEYRARGMRADDARAAARRAFGGVAQVKETYRDQQSLPFLDILGQDLRYAAKTLRRSPGFTAAAVWSLALGLGATTSIFSVINAVLLRPLPYYEPGRLAMLWTDDVKRGIHEEGTSYLTSTDWRNQSAAFADMAVCTRGNAVTLTGGDEPEKVEAEAVSANLFPLLGRAPLLGRTFSSEEAERRDRVVVVSHQLWQRRFAGSLDVLGRTLEINGKTSKVIGVMPSDFYFPSRDTQLWEPTTVYSWWDRSRTARYNDWWRVVGRLKPHVSFEQAQTELSAIGRRLEQAYSTNDPDFAGFGVSVVPLLAQFVGVRLRLALWVLLGAVFFVLLIACANVANLLLARGATREREFAIRLGLGAGRARLIRQLLTESTALALAAGALGLALAAAGIRVLLAFAPQGIPRLNEISLDLRVLAFTGGVSVLTGVVFGLGPALKLSTNSPGDVLKDGGRGSSSGLKLRHARGLLVVAEFALAVVLLAGAGVLIRSFLRIQQVDPGFRLGRLLTLKLELPGAKNQAQKIAYYQQAFERVRSLRGVESVGAISHVFLEFNPDVTITVEGRPAPHPDQAVEQLMDDVVSVDYFTTMGIPLRRGRFFSEQDGPGAPRAALINEAMARRFFPGEDPIGRRFKYGDANAASTPLTIVGVVGDVHRHGTEAPVIPQIFIALSQNPNRGMTFVARTSSDPLTLAAAVRHELRSIDKAATVYGITTVADQLEAFTTERRFQTSLLGLFSVVALVLAALGIYGVISYSVTQRTQELGIRMALGARRVDVLSLIVRQGLTLASIGVAIGLAAAFVLTRLLASLLYEVSATDPLTFVLVSSTLVFAALLACYVPARRAATMDPLIALRCE
jgi:predicted permease